MTDATDTDETPPVDPPAKRGKKGLIFGLVGGLVLGGAGFYAIYAGLIDPFGGADQGSAAGHDGGGADLADVAFLPMEPIMVSLPPGSSARYLRFSGQIETDPANRLEVEQLMPRILDVLNTYLRAVEVADLEQPAAISRLRAQMLRRVQVVTGEGRVRDLLITEFVLN